MCMHRPTMGQGPLAAGQQTDAPPKRRSLFGGGFGRKRAAADSNAPPMQAQQTYPTQQPAGAGIGSGGAPISPTAAGRERGVGAPEQAGAPGGAWAGSRLASEDAEQRGAWAGSGSRATVGLVAIGTIVALACHCPAHCQSTARQRPEPATHALGCSPGWRCC